MTFCLILRVYMFRKKRCYFLSYYGKKQKQIRIWRKMWLLCIHLEIFAQFFLFMQSRKFLYSTSFLILQFFRCTEKTIFEHKLISYWLFIILKFKSINFIPALWRIFLREIFLNVSQTNLFLVCEMERTKTMFQQ